MISGREAGLGMVPEYDNETVDLYSKLHARSYTPDQYVFISTPWIIALHVFLLLAYWCFHKYVKITGVG